jgi:hypothetical protein
MRRFEIAVVAAVVAGSGGAAWATVELAPDGVPDWHASAMARTLDADLEDADNGVIVRGTVSTDRLRYSILIENVPHPGELDLRGLDRRALAAAIEDAIGRARLIGHETLTRPADLPVPSPGVGTAALFALVVGLLVAPFAFGALVLGVGVAPLRSARRTAVAIAAIAVAAAAVFGAGDYLAGTSWAVLVAGGVAWGWFVAVTLPVICPPLPGLANVEHAELGRVLRAWAWLAVERTVVVAAAYAPFAVALLGVAVALDLSAVVAIGVIAPLVGLVVRLAARSWVDVVAAHLDRQLVDEARRPDERSESQHEAASRSNDGDAAWDAAVRGYVMGYVRRAGWAADERLLDGVQFLPGKPGAVDDVATYGGGLGPSRVVIDRGLLERALAPYGRPHDYAAPRVSTLHWTQWNAGLIVPTEIGAIVATSEQRQPRQTADEGGEADHAPLGEPPTLAGVIEPTVFYGSQVYRPHEDPLWLDWDPGEEHDGTDAGDRDFLFGLVIHELGKIRRHEDRAATIELALRRRFAKLPRMRRPALADVHAALNYARHHLVQYLAWRAWRSDDVLTARAYAPELERQSRTILRRLDADTKGDADARRRLGYLAGFLREPVSRPRARTWRRVAIAGAIAAGVAGVAVAVARAIDYHATYVARLKEK